MIMGLNDSYELHASDLGDATTPCVPVTDLTSDGSKYLCLFISNQNFNNSDRLGD